MKIIEKVIKNSYTIAILEREADTYFVSVLSPEVGRLSHKKGLYVTPDMDLEDAMAEFKELVTDNNYQYLQFDF